VRDFKRCRGAAVSYAIQNSKLAHSRCRISGEPDAPRVDVLFEGRGGLGGTGTASDAMMARDNWRRWRDV